MSISFSPSHAYLYSLIKSCSDMETLGMTANWPIYGQFSGHLLSGSAVFEFDDRLVLAIRAMRRFENEFDAYIERRKEGRNDSYSTLPVVREYHALFVYELKQIQDLFSR